VPTKLASEDLVPKQHKDPSFFGRQRIHVYRGRGSNAVEVQPAKINWAQVDSSKFPYILRQDPGPENSLGHVKFTFENAFDVYMHDTPKRALFSRPTRAFSSGCVRVEQPVKLAAYLLREQASGAWTEERIKEVIAQGKRKTVHLQVRMPIYLVYWTAWVDDDANLNFRDDIYGLDAGVRSCSEGACLAAKVPSLQRIQ
jgi:murein L,D-transpeptidase YcbB/YkuD